MPLLAYGNRRSLLCDDQAWEVQRETLDIAVAVGSGKVDRCFEARKRPPMAFHSKPNEDLVRVGRASVGRDVDVIFEIPPVRRGLGQLVALAGEEDVDYFRHKPHGA